MKLSGIQQGLVAACLGCTVLSASALAATTKADALLQVDLNRDSIVERIVTQWSAEIAKAPSSASIRAKLTTLRADQLLAAVNSGTFDGVLEILHTHELSQRYSNLDMSPEGLGKLTPTEIAEQIAQSRATVSDIGKSADKAKSIGSTTFDLTYTPIAPCNLMDTRPGVTPAPPIGAPALAAAYAIRTVQVTGNCAIPTDTQAVVALLTVENIPSSGGVVFAGPAGGSGGAVVSWSAPSQYASGSSIVRLSAAGAMQLQSAGTTHIKVDLVGYFIAPTPTALQCFETAAVTQTGLNIGTTANLTTARCDTGLFGYSYSAVSVNCKTDASPFGSVGEAYTEVFTTGSFPFSSTGERGVCTFINASGTNSTNTYSASAKCCRVPGR